MLRNVTSIQTRLAKIAQACTDLTTSRGSLFHELGATAAHMARLQWLLPLNDSRRAGHHAAMPPPPPAVRNVIRFALPATLAIAILLSAACRRPPEAHE